MENITLEMVDEVMSRTNAGYEQAKEALLAANGNVLDAIILIEKRNNEPAANRLVEKVKEAVRKGNVTKIRVMKDDKIVLTVPVTAGVAGGVLGLIAAPWAVVVTAVAAYGLDCRFELIKEDGTVETVEEFVRDEDKQD